MRIVEVNGTFYPEILIGFPNHTEALDIVADMLDEDIIGCSSDYELITNWYEIGSGENATDNFYDDDQLIKWFNLGGIEEVERDVNKNGHELVHIMDYCIDIDNSELDEDD